MEIKEYDYAKLAEFYDSLEFSKSDSGTNNFLNEFFKKNKIKSVLDITCGTGAQAIFLDKKGYDVTASDLNNDELTYAWKLDGVEIGNKNYFEYQTTYEDAGSHTIKVSVSDGTFETENIWSVTVNNVNRKPLLSEVDDIGVREGDTVVIELEASDPDGDKLSYEIDNEKFVQDGNKFTWKTTYDDQGEYIVTVSVSDGVDTASQKITVTVENVNRAPVIVDIIQKQ